MKETRQERLERGFREYKAENERQRLSGLKDAKQTSGRAEHGLNGGEFTYQPEIDRAEFAPKGAPYYRAECRACHAPAVVFPDYYGVTCAAEEICNTCKAIGLRVTDTKRYYV